VKFVKIIKRNTFDLFNLKKEKYINYNLFIQLSEIKQNNKNNLNYEFQLLLLLFSKNLDHFNFVIFLDIYFRDNEGYGLQKFE
jgi:hypothetical protein